MDQTIPHIEHRDKLNALLRVFLYRSQTGIPAENLEAMLFYLTPVELNVLCERLLYDGIICYVVGPFGLSLKLTEKGIEWIVSGGYARHEHERMKKITTRRRRVAVRYGLMKYLLIGIFCLLLLAGYFFSH